MSKEMFAPEKCPKCCKTTDVEQMAATIEPNHGYGTVGESSGHARRELSARAVELKRLIAGIREGGVGGSSKYNGN